MDASGTLAARFRAACPDDAHAIAGLHADSWQRQYRGAYSDAFPDNDVGGYLLPLWTERLATPNPLARTIVAERDGAASWQQVASLSGHLLVAAVAQSAVGIVDARPEDKLLTGSGFWRPRAGSQDC